MELVIAGSIVFVLSLIGLATSATAATEALSSIHHGYKLTPSERKGQIISRTSGFAAIASILMIIAGLLIYFNVI